MMEMMPYAYLVQLGEVCVHALLIYSYLELRGQRSSLTGLAYHTETDTFTDKTD